MRIVHFEAEPAITERVRLHALATGEPVCLRRVGDGAALRSALAEFSPDVVVADYWLGAAEGWSVVERVRRIAPGVPVIVVSRHLPDELVSHALDAGASDCLTLERLGRLGMALRRSCAAASKRPAQSKSYRSAFMTLTQAFTNAFTNASPPSLPA